MAYQYPYDPVEEEKRRQAEQFGMALPQNMTMRTAPPPPPAAIAQQPPAPPPSQGGFNAATPVAAPPPPPAPTPAADQYNEMLRQGPPKPSWLRALGAAGLGFYQGYNNTNPKARPVDMSGAIDRISGRAGYQEKLGLAEKAADMEQQRAQEAMRQEQHQKQLGLYEKQGKYYDAQTARQEKLMNAPPPPPKPQSPVVVNRGAKVHMPDGTVLDNPIPAPPVREPAGRNRTPEDVLMDPNATDAQKSAAQQILNQKYARKGRKEIDGKPPRASQSSFRIIESEKQRALAALEAKFRDEETNMTPEEFEAEKQRIQNSYEAQIEAAGGTAQHMEYSRGASKPKPPAAPVAPNTASAGVTKLKDPKTGQVRQFAGLSPQELAEAKAQGFIQVP